MWYSYKCVATLFLLSLFLFSFFLFFSWILVGLKVFISKIKELKVNSASFPKI